MRLTFFFAFGFQILGEGRSVPYRIPLCFCARSSCVARYWGISSLKLTATVHRLRVQANSGSARIQQQSLLKCACTSFLRGAESVVAENGMMDVGDEGLDFILPTSPPFRPHLSD